MSEDRIAEIRRKGCVVIRDVVDDEEARTWQSWLREYVSKNPVDGNEASGQPDVAYADPISQGCRRTTSNSSSYSTLGSVRPPLAFPDHCLSQLDEVTGPRAFAPERAQRDDLAQQHVPCEVRPEAGRCRPPDATDLRGSLPHSPPGGAVGRAPASRGR